jgi:hypothetical protein
MVMKLDPGAVAHIWYDHYRRDFHFYFFRLLYSTLLHLPPLKFHCFGRCWDRTQDCCDFGIGNRTLNYWARSHPRS